MKYKATATMTVQLELIFEADNKEEAWEIAEGRDGGEFIEKPGGSNFEIVMIEEVEI